jgi:hypothetical protein
MSDNLTLNDSPRSENRLHVEAAESAVDSMRYLLRNNKNPDTHVVARKVIALLADHFPRIAMVELNGSPSSTK